MVIKASASAEIRTLIEALDADDEVHREAAIARLGIIGARAVERLTDAYAGTSNRRTRLAILRALEVIADHRAAPLARRALGDGGDVAVAATGVLRALLSSRHSSAAAGALDTLIATTLDRHYDRRLRLAAFDALADMPEDVRTRVAAALEADPVAGLGDVAGVISSADGRGRARGSGVEGRDRRTACPTRQTSCARSSPPGAQPPPSMPCGRSSTRSGHRNATLPLTTPGEDGSRCEAPLHQALAFRGSRVALYDLRETLEDAATPLPTSFLTALHVLGDASCLEPLAARLGRRRTGPDHGRTALAPAAGRRARARSPDARRSPGGTR